jgi:hypothetical protein
LLLLERLEKQKPKSPSFEQAMIPFSVLLSTLIVLLTADFNDSFGLKADVWQMFMLTMMVLSALLTAVLLGLWVKNKVFCKTKTSEEIVEDIIKQMKRQQKKFSPEMVKFHSRVDRTSH